MYILRPPPWALAESLVTEEALYLDRRRFLTRGVAALATGLGACERSGVQAPHEPSDDVDPVRFGAPTAPNGFVVAPRNPRFNVIHGRPLTEERLAARYNNFYEFSAQKDRVWKLVGDFITAPWTLEVTGLVHKPKTFALEDLLKRMPHEERVYRFRCVEAWSMVVPWTGFPLKALLDAVAPLASARYVRFVTAERPAQMPGLREQSWHPWPYTEALRLDEALHMLTMLATGIYGKPLPRQHGAPLRLVVPWKYGFKSIKSIVRIELTAERPKTFWTTISPREYSFLGNVNPKVRHPRWSQATERLLGRQRPVPTLPYNGYGLQVADLYTGKR